MKLQKTFTKRELNIEILIKSENKSVEYDFRSYCAHSGKSELLFHRI